MSRVHSCHDVNRNRGPSGKRLAALSAIVLLALAADRAAAQTAVMNVGFLWHMHQPIYYPGENITQTQNANRFSFNVYDVFNQRIGPYTTWPRDAVQSGLSLSHLGAQVSFSGSLVENLNRLEAPGSGNGNFNNWDDPYRQAANWDTSLGNSRLDMVGFPYYHSLMPLLDERDMRMQIKLDKHKAQQMWGVTDAEYKGFFPAETAFSTRMIPALKAEGLDWTLFDSIHLERAVANYPHTNSSNLYAPNKADQINPAIPANQWVQLNNLWAPSRVAAPLAYRPHYAQYVDPASGEIDKIVAVPAARYEGNEDGRGGFGALQYESVMEQYRQFNTDPAHPMYVMLHHDGDNYGGGSDSYYHSNFQNMVSWAAANANYDVTTVKDYLERFPVDPNDVVHIENGSWAGADNGDPEFKKWLGDPGAGGWSPDRNSWAVLTAAKNRVFTADDLTAGDPVVANVAGNVGNASERAWHYLLEAEASDYWYWDGTEIWDSNVTRGSNLAVAQANQVLNAPHAPETTPPTVFIPQREAYNPGGLEWGSTPQPSDFEVWTYAYDVSGLTNVTLKFRVDADGANPLDSIQNETFVGGPEVSAWTSVPMSSSDVAPPAGIAQPSYRALRYGGMVSGVTDALVDYYVEAIDSLGNVTQTDIQHVFVGQGSIVNPGNAVTLSPNPAQAGQSATLSYDPAGRALAGAGQVNLHYGFDGWQAPLPADVAMTWNPSTSKWDATVPITASASQLDVVFNNGTGTWDNNGGQDWHFPVQGTQAPAFTMDGVLDPSVAAVATNGSRHIFAKLQGTTLYLATEDAGEGSDVFLYLADLPGALQAANWAKAGQIAGWDAYLADENDNDYEAWTGAPAGSAIATGPNGGVLEGTIDLAAMFGSVPSEIYLAVGLFGNANGGALVSSQQVPASVNANGNIDSGEFYRLVLSGPSADFDGDFDVDAADLQIWRTAFGLNPNGDANGDSQTDGADLVLWQQQLGTNVSAASTAATVPEPVATASASIAALALAVGRRRRRIVG